MKINVWLEDEWILDHFRVCYSQFFSDFKATVVWNFVDAPQMNTKIDLKIKHTIITIKNKKSARVHATQGG